MGAGVARYPQIPDDPPSSVAIGPGSLDGRSRLEACTTLSASRWLYGEDSPSCGPFRPRATRRPSLRPEIDLVLLPLLGLSCDAFSPPACPSKDGIGPPKSIFARGLVTPNRASLIWQKITPQHATNRLTRFSQITIGCADFSPTPLRVVVSNTSATSGD
jgi:hypothetical protein